MQMLAQEFSQELRIRNGLFYKRMFDGRAVSEAVMSVSDNRSLLPAHSSISVRRIGVSEGVTGCCCRGAHFFCLEGPICTLPPTHSASLSAIDKVQEITFNMS